MWRGAPAAISARSSGTREKKKKKKKKKRRKKKKKRKKKKNKRGKKKEGLRSFAPGRQRHPIRPSGLSFLALPGRRCTPRAATRIVARLAAPMLALIDVLRDGRHVGQKRDFQSRGSSNQRLIDVPMVARAGRGFGGMRKMNI